MSWDALGDLLYRTLFDEAEELRGMFFNLTQAHCSIDKDPLMLKRVYGRLIAQ